MKPKLMVKVVKYGKQHSNYNDYLAINYVF